MTRLLGKLTYANVISTLCLFLLFGGGAYAATRLPRNSVGADQLKQGAVTPAKLSAAARKAFVGAQGPAGPAGAPGAPGPKGDRGAQGEPGPKPITQQPAPRPISLQIPVGPSAANALRTIDGLELKASCIPGESAELKVAARHVDAFGTFAADDPDDRPFLVDDFGSGTVSFPGRGFFHTLEIGIDAREPATTTTFTRLDLHLSARDCLLTGTVIPTVQG